MLPIFQRTFVNNAGDTIALPVSTVTDEATNTLAALFSDRAGTVSIANPVTGDGNGEVVFYVAEGEYKIETAVGSLASELRFFKIGGGGGGGAGAQLSTSTYSTAGKATGSLAQSAFIASIPYDGTQKFVTFNGTIARSVAALSSEVNNVQFYGSVIIPPALIAGITLYSNLDIQLMEPRRFTVPPFIEFPASMHDLNLILDNQGTQVDIRVADIRELFPPLSAATLPQNLLNVITHYNVSDLTVGQSSDSFNRQV